MAVIVSIAGIALFAYMDGIKGSTTLGGASLAGILTNQSALPRDYQMRVAIPTC